MTFVRIKRKILILVPHQDDETNLVGNIMDILVQDEVYVLYSSIDTNPRQASVRKQEAIDACAVWKIDREHIIFLDYPDTPNREGEHFYTNGDKRIEKSIEENILSLKPDIIFATDFDFHSDHRMLSLAFEHVMGKLLKEIHDYRPFILKGFCYETAYYGVEDYVATKINLTVQKLASVSNASYQWDKKISIKSMEKERIIWERRTYKALNCHKSQYAVLHAQSIVNDDNVFWNRRTDNLLYDSRLTASSSDAEKLRDFLILDTNNIIEENPHLIDFSKANWSPDGKSAWITAEWKQKIKFDRIIFHGSLNTTEATTINSSIYADGNLIGQIDKINPYGRDTIFKSDVIECKELKIVFASDNIVLSEIEVLFGDVKFPFDIGEVLKINRNKLIDIYSEFGYKLIAFKTRLDRKVKNLVVSTFGFR